MIFHSNLIMFLHKSFSNLTLDISILLVTSVFLIVIIIVNVYSLTPISTLYKSMGRKKQIYEFGCSPTCEGYISLNSIFKWVILCFLTFDIELILIYILSGTIFKVFVGNIFFISVVLVVCSCCLIEISSNLLLFYLW